MLVNPSGMFQRLKDEMVGGDWLRTPESTCSNNQHVLVLGSSLGRWSTSRWKNKRWAVLWLANQTVSQWDTRTRVAFAREFTTIEDQMRGNNANRSKEVESFSLAGPESRMRLFIALLVQRAAPLARRELAFCRCCASVTQAK